MMCRLRDITLVTTLMGLACATGLYAQEETSAAQVAAQFDAASAVDKTLIISGDSSTSRAATNYATPVRALEPLGDEAREAIGDGRDTLSLSDLGYSDYSEIPEDEMLRLSGLEDEEIAYLPAPLSGAPAHPLALEELLAANREAKPVYYRNAVLERGVSQYSGPLEGALAQEDFRIESADYLDYDSERSLLYGTGGCVVRYGPYILRSDRMMMDTRTRDFQAAGNVVMTNDDTYVSCESLHFNANTNHGVAHGVRGRNGTMYFLGKPDNNNTFTFRQLSREESLMKDVAVTTCDFPTPHLRVQAKEFTVIAKERVLANNAVLYAGDVPVMWLPYFTWSLETGNPWGAVVDLDSKNGLFFRGWYHYYDELESPDPLDDSKVVKVSDSHARVFADWFSDRGRGMGLDYDYSFYDGKSRGRLNLYDFSDSKRKINGQADGERSVYSGWNRTRLGNSNIDLVASLFYPSDPDVFYDILDRFRASGDPKRGRIMERSGSIGLEDSRDNLFVGFNYSFTDRIGRNRTTDFSNPASDDRDFDRRYNNESYYYSGGGTRLTPYPGMYTDPLSTAGSLDEGLDRNRYGRVSEKFQATVATNRIQVLDLPLYYTSTLDIFHNLDKGLNTVSTNDDSYVDGFNFYNSLTNQLRLGERTTLVTQAGIGVGVAQREKNTFDLVPEDATFDPYYITGGQWIDGYLDGVRWTDRETFLVGTEAKSLKDVKSQYGYADVQSRLTSRLTDSITVYAEGKLRKNSGETLGEFYREMGNIRAQDDLYNFAKNESWLETGLYYRSFIPRLNGRIWTGATMDGAGQHTPNQLLNTTAMRWNWTNRINTVGLSTGAAMKEIQVRHHSDPAQYHQNSMQYSVSGRWNSRRNNMYARTSAVILNNRKSDPAAGGILGTNNSTTNLDSRNESVISFGVGREFGRKYLLEYTSNYRTRDEGNTEQFFSLSRDFHDLVATVGFGLTGENLSTTSEDAQQDTWQVRFNMSFKKLSSQSILPFLRSSTEYNQSTLGAFQPGS